MVLDGSLTKELRHSDDNKKSFIKSAKVQINTDTTSHIKWLKMNKDEKTVFNHTRPRHKQQTPQFCSCCSYRDVTHNNYYVL